MADSEPSVSIRHNMDAVPEFDRVLQCLSEDAADVKDLVSGYAHFQELATLRDGDALNQRICADMRLFCSCIQRDIVSSNEEISSVALKVLGFLLQRESFLTSLPDDEASKLILTVLALITTTNKKTVCGLGLWCLAVQQMKPSLMAQHLKKIVTALLHGIDNPLGSVAVTYEAFQAVEQLARQLPDEMRNLSWTWAPSVYQKLLISSAKIAELAANCLSGTKSVVLPPLRRLSEVVGADIQNRLLSKMEEMIKLEGRSLCLALKAWAWLVKLLGVKSTEEKSLINVLLKLPEATFVSPSTPVRAASQVAWVSVIDVFMPSPSEAGSNASPRAIATPSVGGTLSPKQLQLLMMPLLHTMGWEKDMAVQRSCCCTWIHLLCTLGQSVNDRLFFEAAVLPILEVVFRLDKKSRDESVWQACVDVLTDAIFCKGSQETRSHAETLGSGANQSPKTPGGIAYTGVYTESHHKKIKWSSWNVDRLESFVMSLHTLCTSGLRQFDEVKSEDGHPPPVNESFEAARKCWRLLVKGVEAEGRNTVRPSSDHVTAVRLLLKFLSSICTDVQSKQLLPAVWELIEILIDGLGHNVMSSSFYRTRLQFTGHVDFVQDTHGTCSPYADPDMVTPVVYIAATWFKLVFKTSSMGHKEDIWLLPIEKLITSGRAGFYVMGNYSGFAWILDHLVKHSHLHREESPDMKKSFSDSNSELLRSSNWHFLLEVWRIVAEKLRDLVERSNDVPPVGGCQRDSGYQVVSDVLLFPIKCFLLLPPESQPTEGEFSGTSSQRHGRSQSDSSVRPEAELLSTEGGWFKLFDSVLRISSLKSPHPNSFIGGFFHRVIKIIRSSLQEPAPLLSGGMRRLRFESSSLSKPCLRFLGVTVAHALKHAEVSNLAMLAISRKRRKTGFGASSVRVQCVAGMELEDANNLKDLLTVAGRLLTLSYDNYRRDKKLSSIHEPAVRVLGALTGLMQHITSLNDSVLLLQALTQPLSCWLTVKPEGSGSRAEGMSHVGPLPVSVLKELSQAWDAVLVCLQTCRPSMTFDSKLLLVQSSSLGPAFLHHYDAISNRTVAFWESTYGTKTSHLSYPPALAKVFNSLKQKIAISLPGWTTKPVAATDFVHDAPQRFYRPAHSKMRQFKELLESKRNAGEKRGVMMTTDDHQVDSVVPQETKFGPVEQPGGLKLRHQMDDPRSHLRQPSVCSDDTTELQVPVKNPNGSSPEQQNELLSTPEGNALTDELVNRDCVSQLNAEEVNKRNSPGQSAVSSAKVSPTDVPAPSEGQQADTEDSQAVELLSMLDITNLLRDCEVRLDSEETEFASSGGIEVVHTGNNSANIINETGAVDLVTPPVALIDIPSVPPNMPVGPERPEGNVNGGVEAIAVGAADGSNGIQAVANLPRRRKKLKFQEDSQDVEYVVVPKSHKKKAGPLIDRQREVPLAPRNSGQVVKTYCRAEFSQSCAGCADELLESQALEPDVETTCKENVPPSNLRDFQDCAAAGGAASQLKIEEPPPITDSTLPDDGVKTVPLNGMDYIQLKNRLVTTLHNDPTLTYRQVFDQERYEFLPRLIQNRLGSQFSKLKKVGLESKGVMDADRPHSPSGAKTEVGGSKELATANGKQIPSTFLVRRKPELHVCSKRQVSRRCVNLRSSGRLRGGKHWRINSELGKVITARLGIKKIVAKKQQFCSNLVPNVDGLPVVEGNDVDANPAGCDTKTWGTRQTRQRNNQNSENMSVHHPAQAPGKASSQRQEITTAIFPDCKEKSIGVQELHQPPTILQLASELQENFPFQVRNLNRGLLANSFSRASDSLSAQNSGQACRSAWANGHKPRKSRAPRRVWSHENSTDENPSQFRISERFVGEREAATTSGPQHGSMAPRNCDATHFTPSYIYRADAGNVCSITEGPDSPLIFVCLEVEESPAQPSCSYDGDTNGTVLASFLENPRPEPSVNTEVSYAGSTHEDTPSDDAEFRTPVGGLNLPESSQRQTDLEVNPPEPSEDFRNETVSEVQAMLERQDVHVCHVLSALLASAKLKRMGTTEVNHVDKLLSQLREAVAGHKGESLVFTTPTTT